MQPAFGAVNGRSADLLGDGVLIPSGDVVRGGASYTTVDGYGFINAEAAVKAVRRK